MSTQQFGRKVSLVIGQDGGDALDLSELRIRFDVRRGDLQTPNSARIRVYNVAPDTARRAQNEFTRVVLQAGYEGNYGIIFDGTIKQVRRGRESQTDTYLDITAADGDSAYNFAVVNTTLAAGSTVVDHVGSCTRAMESYGVTLGYTPWGQRARKPTADEIAQQEAVVEASRKAADDRLNESSAVLSDGIKARIEGDALRDAGDAAGARQKYLQAQALIQQSDQIAKEVDAVYLPAWRREKAKLDSMKAQAAVPDAPIVEMQGLPRGKVLFGMARDFMRSAAKTTQTVWSIQDGRLIFVPETSYMPGDIPVITSDTGMVGLPEQTQNGITIKMLLNPSVKIGRLIQIDNASVQQYEYGLSTGQQPQNHRIQEQAKLQDDGYYYVMIAEHYGDTRGNEFYTEVICLAADVTVLPDSFRNRTEVPPENVIKKFG